MKSLNLELNLDTGKFTAKMTQAGRETERLERNVAGLNKELIKTGRTAQSSWSSLERGVVVLGNLRSAIETTRYFFTGLASAAVSATAEIERTFHLLKNMSKADTGAGQIAEATANLEYLMTKAKEAPFSIQAMSDAFVKFKAGGIDPLAGGFQALLDATAAFGGGDEVFKRAAVAIQQMGGKGTVSLEELRQQLGEAIPTAINLMADGMGMSYKQLVDEISKGNVRSGPALEKMFAQMEKVYGGSAQRMMDTYQGKVAQLKSSLLQLSLAFTGMDTSGQAKAGGFYDTLKTSIEGITNVFNDPQFQESVAKFGQNIGVAANALTMMVGTLGHIASFIPVLSNISVIMATIGAVIIGKFAGAGAAALKDYFGKYTAGMNEAIGKERALDTQRKASALTEMQKARAEQARRAEDVAKHESKRLQIAEEIAGLEAQILKTNELIAAEAKQAQMAKNRQGLDGRMITAKAQNELLDRQKTLTNQLSVATTNLKNQKILLEGATKRATVAEGQLAVATANATVATNSHAAAIGLKARVALGATVAMNGLKAAMAFLGGPWGVAIMIISAAFTALAGAAAKANEKMKAGEEVVKDLTAMTAAGEERIGKLTEEINENADASMTAEDKAKKLKGAYEDLGVAAINAAQNVKYLNDETRVANLKTVNDANDTTEQQLNLKQGQLSRQRIAIVSRGSGSGQTRGWYNLSETEKDTRVDTALNTLKTGDSGDVRQFNAYHKLRSEVETLTKKLAEGRQAASALQSSIGTTTETKEEKPKPEAVETPTEVSTPKAKDISDAEKALAEYEERAARIKEEMAGVGSEVAKMSYLTEKGKFSTEADSVKKKLMDAAKAMDALMVEQKGHTAMADMTKQLEAQQEHAALLRQQIDAVLAGASASDQASISFTASLKDNVDAAKAAGKETDGIKQDLIDGDKALGRLNDKLNALKDLERTLKSTKASADAAWGDFLAGANETDRATARLSRRLDEIDEQFSGAGDEEQRAAARRQAEQAHHQDARRLAAERLMDMRRETAELNIAASTSSQAKRDRMALDLQAEQHRAAIHNNTLMSVEEQRIAWAEYYAWKDAKERELKSNNPMYGMLQGWGDMMGNLSEGFAGFFNDFTGALADSETDFKEFAKNMITQIIKIVAQALIAHAVLAGLGAIGIGPQAAPAAAPAATPAATPSAGGFVTAPRTIAHTGGIIGGTGNASRTGISGAVFAGAMKYHTGGVAGLKPREVPAILQEGEGVFTREQMANMAPVGSMQPPSVKIEIVNESGHEMDAQQNGGMKFDGREWVLGIVMDAVSKPGKMRDGFKGAMAQP